MGSHSHFSRCSRASSNVPLLLSNICPTLIPPATVSLHSRRWDLPTKPWKLQIHHGNSGNSHFWICCPTSAAWNDLGMHNSVPSLHSSKLREGIQGFLGKKPEVPSGSWPPGKDLAPLGKVRHLGSLDQWEFRGEFDFPGLFLLSFCLERCGEIEESWEKK